ncbi:uncharacterized protein LOC131168400 [Malania oleifera]|uniref:uncharacterized protein LOC131168400 n=1 Tax=Malania oleifera TaxID=397392 RepID=UPI0025ADFD2C|nr:uncharacterized protein LOC131168400 [Malania oleifera]
MTTAAPFSPLYLSVTSPSQSCHIHLPHVRLPATQISVLRYYDSHLVRRHTAIGLSQRQHPHLTTPPSISLTQAKPTPAMQQTSSSVAPRHLSVAIAIQPRAAPTTTSATPLGTTIANRHVVAIAHSRVHRHRRHRLPARSSTICSSQLRSSPPQQFIFGSL